MSTSKAKTSRSGQVEVLSPDRHSWLNSHGWDRNIPCPMSRADIDRFQREIDDLVGVEPDGMHRMRIVWGQDPATTNIWDRYCRTYRLRYLWRRDDRQVLNPATGVLEVKHDWTGIPRLWIEAYIPNIHHAATADSPDSREHFEADGVKVAEARDLDRGIYIPATVICMHSMLVDKSGWRPCCLKATKAGYKCFGDYREVDAIDIDELRKGMADRLGTKLSRPDQRITPQDKELAYLGYVTDSLRNFRREQEERAYRRRETMNTLKHWVDGVPGKKGRFA
jgi:hypothetical protein